MRRILAYHLGNSCIFPTDKVAEVHSVLSAINCWDPLPCLLLSTVGHYLHHVTLASCIKCLLVGHQAICPGRKETLLPKKETGEEREPRPLPLVVAEMPQKALSHRGMERQHLKPYTFWESEKQPGEKRATATARMMDTVAFSLASLHRRPFFKSSLICSSQYPAILLLHFVFNC